MTTNTEIIEALEALGAACPWQSVEIWVTREPAGQYDFTALANEDAKFGLRQLWGHCGKTPMEAVHRLVENILPEMSDPNACRKAKITELRGQIEKLQAVVIGLPPYKPGRELAQTNGKAPAVPPTINV